MTRWTLLALGLVLAALAAVAVVSLRMAGEDRRRLVAQLGDERARLLDETASVIGLELGDIGEDLRFAAELVHATSREDDRTRALGALLAAVRHYRLVQVFGIEGTQLLSVVDPLAAPSFDARPFDGMMRETARAALSAGMLGEVVSSSSIASTPNAWFRAFAIASPSTDFAGAVVILVDTEPLLAKLRVVSSAPATRVLVLGPHHRPAPPSDPVLVRALDAADRRGQASPGMAALRDGMVRGETGMVAIDADEARRLGLGPADLVAAHTQVVLGSSAPWSFAAVTSTSAIEAQVQASLRRLLAVSAAIALSFVGFASYVVIASRRAVTLREQLRHANRLAHLHDKTEKILDHIPAGVMVLSDALRVTSLNHSLRARLPGVVSGSTLEAALSGAPDDVVARTRELVDDALRLGRVQSLVGERLVLFGEEGRYSLHAVPLEPRFPEARVLLVIDDLSAVDLLTSQLLRAEKLSTVGVLAAGVAHEIGTPLGIVRARGEHLLGKLGPESPLVPGARVIVEQIDLVVRTIRQLLDFSRVQPVAVRPTELAPIARTVRELLRFEAERRRVAVEIDAEASLPPLSADPDQLQQVLVNLVLNACDACAAEGKVRLTARAEEGSRPPRVRIEVIDDGCGIAPEHQHQVFDPFFTTKKRGQGTGLGLTIAAQIVRNHGGEIVLESEPGGGTRVTLLWPASQPEQPAQEEAHARAS